MNSVQMAWEATIQGPKDLLARRLNLGRCLTHWFASWMIHFLLVILYVSVIGGVSAYDSVLTARYAISLYDLELNPMGRWIMDLDNWETEGVSPADPPDVGSFLVLKGIGTCVTLGVIIGLVFRFRRIGHAVGAGVTLFQLVLAGFLTMA